MIWGNGVSLVNFYEGAGFLLTPQEIPSICRSFGCSSIHGFHVQRNRQGAASCDGEQTR